MHRPTIRRRFLSRRARTNSQRGVVFLFTSYLVSFTLLVLVTAMFVRSTNELRMAERSAQTQQAFWLSEASLDRGLREVLLQEPTYLVVPASTMWVGTGGPMGPASCNPWKGLSLSSDQQTSYQICRTGQTSYEINADGTKQGTTQRTELLTGEVERVTPQIEFKHTIYAASPIVVNYSFVDGSVATSAKDRGALQFTMLSFMQGAISLPKDHAVDALQLLNGSAWVDLKGKPVTDPNSQIQELQVEKMGDFIPIVVPQNLGTVPGADADQVLRKGDAFGACLPPGTYYAKGIALTNATLCTDGRVDLYVEGPIQATNSWIYGQPRKTPDVNWVGRQDYSSEDLHIFALPDQGGHNTISLQGVSAAPVTAALIYAPDMNVTMSGGHMLRGGLISKTAVMQGAWASDWGRLQNNPPAVKHSQDLARVDIRAWGIHGKGTKFGQFVFAPPPPPVGTGGFSGGGGGCGGGGGGSVICTEMHRQGLISDAWYAADSAFGLQQERSTMLLYQRWANHVVAAMQRSRLVTSLVAPLARAWAHHMAYEMGMSQTDDPLGWLLNAVGLPIHQMLGRLLVQHGQ